MMQNEYGIFDKTDFNDSDNSPLSQLLRHESRKLEPCVLCKCLTHARGIHITNDKKRVVIYPVCHRHPWSTKTADKIDAVIYSEGQAWPIKYKWTENGELKKS